MNRYRRSARASPDPISVTSNPGIAASSLATDSNATSAPRVTRCSPCRMNATRIAGDSGRSLTPLAPVLSEKPKCLDERLVFRSIPASSSRTEFHARPDIDQVHALEEKLREPPVAIPLHQVTPPPAVNVPRVRGHPRRVRR